MHAIATSGQYFVRIGLMSDVPDNSVIGRIENMMQSNGQLNCTQTSAEMPSGFGHRMHEVLSYLTGQRSEILNAEGVEVSGVLNILQKRVVI